ncbi:ShlB/FhaC/HecB family hemolysin secretion/activation protein [Luteimonas deserti]
MLRTARAGACAMALSVSASGLAQDGAPPAGWQPGDQERALRARPAETAPPLSVVPPLRERGSAQTGMLEIRGFRITGVGEHPTRGITPASMQALLDAYYAEVSGGADRVTLDFDRIADAALPVTAAYRAAGYVVSAAYLPAQSVGADGIVEIAVLEGRLGRVIVEGNERVRATAVAAPARRLTGRILHRDEVEAALLAMRDLPGIATAAVLQPGAETGETDLLVTVTEEPRPYSISIGASNHGTELTGRNRVQLGVAWRNALGVGDVVSLGYARGYAPAQSDFASFAWTVPVPALDGVSLVAAYSRSEMEVRRGPFAQLNLTGPTAVAQLGADWRFVSRPTLQMQGSARYVRERSQLQVFGGMQLSDQAFDVVDLGYVLRHIDRRARGVNLVQANLRHAVDDRSAAGPDSITPARSSDFTLLRLSLARMQYLTQSQRLFARVYGQYTDDVLVPMEQIALGGPDSIRSLPVSDALGDRGYQATLEYQVDAPGFGAVASPFGGRPWRDLLQFELFADHGRVTASPGSLSPAEGRTYNGAGAGLLFRLPHVHNLELRIAGAVPVGGRFDASDGDDVRVWARFGMTF